MLRPRWRKLALLAHVAASVGWLGAVIVFLAIAIIGLTSGDETTVRGAYLLMEKAAWLTLLPLAGATLLTGLVSSLGTPWGLFQHYWVVIKLALTVLATAILVIYMQTFGAMAANAADPAVALTVVRNPSPVVHAVLALAVLLGASALAVYKPRGMTRYGWRKKGTAGGGALAKEKGPTRT